MADYLLVRSKLGRYIRISEVYWNKIVTLKHPVMAGKEKQVIKAVEDPYIVKESERDAKVCLYYRSFGKRYISVVVRHENGTGFIITCYPVDKIKKGKIIYEKTKSIL